MATKKKQTNNNRRNIGFHEADSNNVYMLENRRKYYKPEYKESTWHMEAWNTEPADKPLWHFAIEKTDGKQQMMGGKSKSIEKLLRRTKSPATKVTHYCGIITAKYMPLMFKLHKNVELMVKQVFMIKYFGFYTNQGWKICYYL